MSKISLRAYNRDINTLIENNQADAAIAHCKHILTIFPKHIDTYRLLGRAYLEIERFNEASDIFQRVLSTIPDDFSSQVGMGAVRESENNLDAAIWHIERAFEVQPSNPVIQNELRRLYQLRDDIEPPKMRLTRGALVRMYARGELYPQAVSEAIAVLSEDSHRIDIELIQAQMYYHLNQKEEAVDLCLSVLKKAPYCFEANRILAELLPDLSRFEEAEQCRKNVSELDPYYSFINSQSPYSHLVADDSVILEKLERISGLEDASFIISEDESTVTIAKEEENIPDWMEEARFEADDIGDVPDEEISPIISAERIDPSSLEDINVAKISDSENNNIIDDFDQFEKGFAWLDSITSQDIVESDNIARYNPIPSESIIDEDQPASIPRPSEADISIESSQPLPEMNNDILFTDESIKELFNGHLDDSISPEDLKLPNQVSKIPVDDSQEMIDNILKEQLPEEPTSEEILSDQIHDTPEEATKEIVEDLKAIDLESIDELLLNAETSFDFSAIDDSIEGIEDEQIEIVDEIESLIEEDDMISISTADKNNKFEYEKPVDDHESNDELLFRLDSAEESGGVIKIKSSMPDEKQYDKFEVTLPSLDETDEKIDVILPSPEQDIRDDKENIIPEWFLDDIKSDDNIEGEFPEWVLETDDQILESESYDPQAAIDRMFVEKSSIDSSTFNLTEESDIHEDTTPEEKPIIATKEIDEITMIDDEALPEWIKDSFISDFRNEQQDTFKPAIPIINHSEWIPEIQAIQTNQQSHLGKDISPESFHDHTLEIDISPIYSSKDDNIIQEIRSDSTNILNSARSAVRKGNLLSALDYYNQLLVDGINLPNIIQDIEIISQNHPFEASVWQILGDAYAKNNQLKNALDAYSKAEELLH